MDRFSDLIIVQEFNNNGETYGVYSVCFKGKQEIFIRNDMSIGVVRFLYDKPADKCVSIIRDDVKAEFFEYLDRVR